MSASADGLFQQLRNAKLNAPGGNGGRWRTGGRQNGNYYPQPGAGSQYRASDVGIVVVKDKAAHAIEVATLRKIVSRGIVEPIA